MRRSFRVYGDNSLKLKGKGLRPAERQVAARWSVRLRNALLEAGAVGEA